MGLSEAEELEMLELEEQEALLAQGTQKADASVGIGPQPQAIGDQLEIVRQHEMKERAKRQADPRHNAFSPMDLARGMKAGLSGASLKDPTLAESVGQAAGEYGPIVIPSAMAAAATGGGSLLASAAAQFAGVGAGQAYKQIISRAMGGKAPETPQEAQNEIMSAGLGAAMADLGLGIGGKAVGKALGVLESFASTYLKVPAEAIKRAILRPYAMETGGPAAQLGLENKGIKILSEIQDNILAKRKEVGASVESALENLHKKTKGEKVFDIRPLADDLEQFMAEGLRAEDPMVKKLMAGDYIKVKNLLKTMRDKPMKDARAMVAIRRELDKMQTFNFGGVPKIESEAGTLAVRRLADSFRTVIDKAGDVLNFSELKNANAAAHSFYDDYDSLRRIVGTEDKGRLSMINRIDRLENFFNKGGVRQDLIKEIGDKFPKLRGKIDDLMDMLASRSFVRNSVGTPSGNVKDLARMLMSPQNVAKTIKAGQSAPVKIVKEIGKTAATVAGAKAGEELNK